MPLNQRLLFTHPPALMKSIRSFKSFCLALCLILPGMASAEESVAELIKKGDVSDQKFCPTEALASYLPAEKLEPNNVGLLLCIARQYRHLMADAPELADKIKFANTGKTYAARAVTLSPKEAEAHLSVALSYAKLVPFLDTKEKMEASRQVKISVDQAIALDPGKDLAWHVLGTWHQRLADIGMVKRAMAKLVYGELPAATNEEAVHCFQKAIQLNPDRLIHHIELGRTYAQMGKETEARQCINKGLAMPNTGKDDPEVKARGQATLADL
jgi:tetratricopeptide (TPR) repeat protein